MKIRILIIEDEERSARRLEKLILDINADAVVEAKCESVEDTLRWLSEHEAPDLIFSDIQLSDGLSFEVFEKIENASPVIFTTAYDQYAIRAFKNNGIDYLLKPIVPDELATSLERFVYGKSKENQLSNQRQMAALAAAMLGEGRSYRTRFLVKMGEKFKSFEASELVCIEGRDKATWIITKDGRNYPVDDTLEKLEKSLDPAKFFRISRKYIVNFDAIKQMETWPNSRVKLILNGHATDDIIVARERTQDFKQWMGQ